MKQIFLIAIVVILLILIVFGGYLAVQSFKDSPKKKFIKEDEKNKKQALSSYDIQGMKIEILKQGTGEGAKVGDNILVDYVGTLEDGSQFDSSISRNQSFPYTLGQNRVIQGWELGLLGMKVGEKRKLTIPPELAYGEQGRPPVIPESATLIFEIDMLKIN